MSRLRSRALIGWSLLVWIVAGCAGAFMPGPPELLFYGSVPEAPPRQGQAIVARASARGRNLSMVFSHSSSAPIRLNYMSDVYAGRTFDGRTVTLEKGSVLAYPDASGPGQVEPLTIALPPGYSPSDLAELRATVNYGATTIVLTPINPALRAPVQEPIIATSMPLRAGAGRGRILAARATEPVIAPLPENQPMAVATPAPTPAPPPKPPEPQPEPIPVLTSHEATGLESSQMTVPTTIEFLQVLGSHLQGSIQWNGTDALDLSPGDRRTFRLIPGHHELAFLCRMPAIAETSGRIPVPAWPQQPIRIVLEARARLTGAEVRARVWQGENLTLDQDFAPQRQEE